jgi:hypothetical protein
VITECKKLNGSPCRGEQGHALRPVTAARLAPVVLRSYCLQNNGLRRGRVRPWSLSAALRCVSFTGKNTEVNWATLQHLRVFSIEPSEHGDFGLYVLNRQNGCWAVKQRYIFHGT